MTTQRNGVLGQLRLIPNMPGDPHVMYFQVKFMILYHSLTMHNHHIFIDVMMLVTNTLDRDAKEPGSYRCAMDQP